MGMVSDVAPGTVLADIVPEPFVVPEQPVTPFTSDSNEGLAGKVFFLLIRRGSLGNTRKVANAEVIKDKAEFDQGLLRVSKTLLESTELRAINTHDYLLRKWLTNTCLPFETGLMLLPKGFLVNAKAKLKEHAEEREALIDAFVAAYPAAKLKAKENLKELYDDADYPPVEEIKSKFTFECKFIDFKTPESLKEIDAELYAEEKAKEKANFTNAIESVTSIMRQTMFEMVEHLKDKLTPGPDGKPKILKESAIANLKEFLETFDLRNISDDKELAIEVAKAKALLGGTNAQAIRNSDEWREKIRAGMEHITTNLGDMVVVKPGRKFRDA